MRFRILLLVFSCLLISIKVNAQTASFNAPDTVCRGQNITINNTSTGQSTNLWNFCKQKLVQNAIGVNLGALVNMPVRPYGIEIFKEGSNWIGFLGNDAPLPGTPLRKLDFGTSLLNTPSISILPAFSQLAIPRIIRFLKEGNNWYAIVISGRDNNAGNYQGCAVLSFGNSLNNTPTLLTNIGNLNGSIGGGETVTGVSIEKSGNNVVAFISTSESGTGRLYRINFGATITNPSPTYASLGSFGVFTALNVIRLIQINGNWYGFLANDGYPNNPTNDKLFRLNFGNSLLNTPTLTNFGNPNLQMNRIYDLLPYSDCESVKLLGANLGNSQLISFSFPLGMVSNQANASTLGNVGTLNQPSGFSQILIENGQKYVFVSNSNSNTISRILVEPACNPVGVPTSTATNPPIFTADSIGTMTVSLTIDKNLSSEASTCQEIVVIDTIKKPDARINTITCSTDSIRLTIANIDSTATYSWIGPNSFTSIKPNVSIKFNGNNSQNGNYIITTTGRCGVKKDTVSLNASCVVCVPNFTAPDTVCLGDRVTINNLTTCQTTNLWNFCKQKLVQGAIGTNLGALVNMPVRPYGIEIFKEGSNWIGFLGNDAPLPGTPLRKLDFGTSLLNTPSISILPAFSQLAIPRIIRFLKEGNNWYAIVISGRDNNAGNYQGCAVLSFGNSLNNTPTLLTNIGNLNGSIGGGETVTGVSIEKSGNNVVAFISTSESGTGRLYRINFGATITNPSPTYASLGSFGVFTALNVIRLIQINGNWYGFLANDGYPNNPTNDKLFRLNFGNSLLNTPTLTNFGNPNLQMNRIYDLLPYSDCESVKLLGANLGNSQLISFSFPLGMVSNQANASTLGNVSTLNQPSGFSQILIENGQKYVFVSNSNSNTISRILVEPACNPVGVPTSTATNPPIFTADSIGTMTVSLTIDKNLSSEASTCQEIVVIDTIKKPDARINTITCSTDSIRLTIANIDATATYSWIGPNGFTSTRPNVSIKFSNANQAGQYIVTAIGRCGTKKDTVSFVSPTGTFVNLGRDTSICQGNTVTLNATTSGTTVTYLWNNGAVTPTISVNQAGTYFVKVTADGCSASDTIRVTILTPPTAFSIGNDTTYCGNFSRILSTGNANTVWSTGVTAAQITVTQPNTYFATITNSCGTKKDTIVINQNIIPLVNIGKDTSICQGNTVTLNATTSGTTVTYLWNNGAVTPTISVNQAGTYFVKVTADGCSASDTIRVTILTPPTAFSIGNDTTYCGNFSRILSTGNANTVWSTGVTAAQITVTQPNTYFATITNSCGTKKDTIVINQNIIPLVNIGKDTSICQGNTVTLNATTSGTTVTYLWNNGAVTPTISVNQAGTYFVKVTADGCSASDTIRVTILTPPTAFSIGNDTTYCGSFSRILSTGNASTVWSTGVTAAQITVTQPNTYIATITNSCGTKKDTIVINQNNIPLINLGKDTSICQGNTVTLNATTSGTTVTYLWNNGAVTPTISVNQAGTYFVKVTADGCSAYDTIRVTILTPPTAFSIGNDTTYCGSFSRILSTGNASTVWSTGVTAAQITVTQPNTYIATITNSCGTKKDTIVINQNNIPLINLGKDTSICQGNTVTLNATTSGTTVTYLWNNGVVTPTISVNQAGTYFVKVTADGCSASDTIRVTILTPPTAFSIGNDTTYCGSFSRILSTGNASTVWSTGVTAAQITVTQPNTYIATITNSCGTKKDTIVINQNNIPLVNLGKDTSICQGNAVTLNATTSGTTVTYLWNNGAVTPTISVNQAGTYFVKVTADGCSASDTIRVTILTPPTTFSIGNDTTYCGSFTKILSTGNANTVWSTGVTAAQITVTQPNTYIATITNSCGSESDSILIFQDEIPTVQINKDTMICGGQPILLTAITNASQFIWNTGETGNSITINQAGKYWVSVTNNTCTAVDTVYIMECEGDLWVPTAFSPNNDGVNDYFKIFGKNVLEYKLLVFNRWGEFLFESNDIRISWDGSYKGEIVQVDSYVWVVEYKIILGGKQQNKIKKGTVTVLR